MRKLTIESQSWPVAGKFTISRGSKTTADVVMVTISKDGAAGRGECVPYPRYGENVEQTIAELEAARSQIEAGLQRDEISSVLKGKAARNAVDCALWDFEAKYSGFPVWKLAGLPEPEPVVTAYTISLDTPAEMARIAASHSHLPLLKLKLGAEGDEQRIRAIRKAAPNTRLIIDANEGWNEDNIQTMLNACAAANIEMAEQPLSADSDDILQKITSPITLCADESAHDIASLDGLTGKYSMINIKLDKTGGLTPALELAAAARKKGFEIMTGTMLCTSLAIAPAFLLAQTSAIADIDGPLLLARDRKTPVKYENATALPPAAKLWG